MNTRPLVLAQLHKGVYQDNLACAYIYYGTVAHSVDHEGSHIGTFFDDSKRIALEQHINNTILPLIQPALEKVGYTAAGVDYLNMAPHPFVMITRQDKHELNQHDLDAIKSTLTGFLIQHNNNTLQKSNTKQVRFFEPKPTNDAQENNNQTMHHYNLRSRGKH